MNEFILNPWIFILLLMVTGILVFILEPYLELEGRRIFSFLKRGLLKFRTYLYLYLYRWNLFDPTNPRFRTKLTELIDAYADEPIIAFDTLLLPSLPKKYNATWVIQILKQLPEKKMLKLIEEWHDPTRPTKLIKAIKSEEEKITWIELILKNLKTKNRGVEIVRDVFKGMSEGEIVQLLRKFSLESLKELGEKSDIVDFAYLLLLVEANLKTKDVGSGEDLLFTKKVLNTISWEKARELQTTCRALWNKFPNLRQGLSSEQREAFMNQLRLALAQREAAELMVSPEEEEENA
ncbi:MAG TPA: hypothetical protein VNM22_02310 [Candidatus Limnocylindrales bacterium]|nr:hypothetical protein [Candidatus Limnocylindrales bacterium]